MSKKIILFNGPPSSGKDTAADIFYKLYQADTYQYKMAKPLKESCHSILGLEGDNKYFESIKELPIAFKTVDGSEMTLRQFYIHMSEKVLKPMFGKAVFGHMAVEYLKNIDLPLYTISDAGFVEEAEPIIEYFGKENVWLVRIFREGKNFSIDSRGYIELPVTTVDVENNGNLEELEETLKEVFKKIV